MELYQRILKSFFAQSNNDRLERIKQLDSEIRKNNERTNTAMRLMLDGEIESLSTKRSNQNTKALIRRC
jgi:hypothetical protein